LEKGEDMTAISSLASLPGKGFNAFVKGNPLTAFIGLSFSITWLLADLPLILAQNGLGVVPITLPSDWFILLGTAMGMAGSAFYVTYVLGGRDGVANLISQYLKWRVNLLWYVLVFFQGILLLGGSLLAGATTFDTLIQNWKLLFLEFLPAALSILIFGQLWEEVGWRGFVLPRIQSLYGPFASSLILAGLQTLWHIPGFFFAGGITAPDEKLVITVPYLLGAFTQTLIASLIIGILATWIYNSTKGSLLVIILFHTFSNASARMVMTHITNQLMRARVASVASVGLIVLVLSVLIFTRGKLAYRVKTPDRST
jgi:uncharacterized protein